MKFNMNTNPDLIALQLSRLKSLTPLTGEYFTPMDYPLPEFFNVDHTSIDVILTPDTPRLYTEMVVDVNTRMILAVWIHQKTFSWYDCLKRIIKSYQQTGNYTKSSDKS